MKNKIYKWFNILMIPVKIALVVALIFYAYEGLNKVFYNKEVDDGRSFRAMPENSVDVLVLGSSDSQYSFIPSFFYEDTGLTSYVRGSACQPLKVSYEMLKDSLKTQQPKMVILEVFTAMPLKKTCHGDSCFVIAQYQMDGDEKYETIDFLPEDKAKEYYNDFLNYHNDWRTVDDIEVFIKDAITKNEAEIDTSFGYLYQNDPGENPQNWWVATTYDEFVPFELESEDLNALNNMYDLCREKGIELFLYKTPIDGITVEDQSALYKVWEWADEHNVEYYDFVDKSPKLYFYMQMNSDSYHCYLSGANIVTTKLAEIVNEKYVLEASHDDYIDDLYRTDSGWLTGKLMEGDRFARRWIRRLAKAQGYILVDYKASSYLPDDVYEMMIEMGFPHFDRNMNYKAIVKDGVVLTDGFEAVEVYDGDILIRVGNNAMHVGDKDCVLDAPLTFGYIVEKNITRPYYGGVIYTSEGMRTAGFYN